MTLKRNVCVFFFMCCKYCHISSYGRLNIVSINGFFLKKLEIKFNSLSFICKIRESSNVWAILKPLYVQKPSLKDDNLLSVFVFVRMYVYNVSNGILTFLKSLTLLSYVFSFNINCFLTITNDQKTANYKIANN